MQKDRQKVFVDEQDKKLKQLAAKMEREQEKRIEVLP